MRARTAAVTALMVFATTIPAQAQVGITVGGIYSDASVEYAGVDRATDYRTGFQAGVSYATGGIFGVIVGGYYTQKGFDLAGSSDEVKLAYIEVPVMGVVRLPILERVIGPRLYGGIDGAFEVSCDTTGAGEIVTGLCDETNSFDFGLRGGVGIQVLFLGLDFAYTYGLTDVAKASNLSIKNRAWSLALLIGVG